MKTRLEKLTKDELIFIIEQLQQYPFTNFNYYIKRALNDLGYKKEIDKINEADKYAKIAHEKRMEFLNIMKEYEGKKIGEMPQEILEKSNRLIKEAQSADEKYNKLMGIEG